MALSNDQKALLRLLAQREEGYEDIAALMGLSVEEVRGRVKDALAELGREPRDEPRSAAGPVAAQGSSSSQAAGEQPSPAPPATEASQPEKDQPAPSPALPPTEPSVPRASRAAAGWRSLSGRSRRRLFELAGGVALVALVILFATGAVDIGGDDSDGDSGDDAALAGQIPTSGGKQPTQAALREVNGSGARARALFGRSGQQVLLVIAGEGLRPSAKGRSYAVSLENEEGERIPIAATRVGKSGAISGQFQVSPDSLGLLASGYDRMVVSRVVNKQLAAALKAAQRRKEAPEVSGEDVLRGPVTGPIVGAAEAE